MLLLGLALAIVSLAQPRWGYTFEDVKRKGLDLLIAVDTSRSMLSNDVQPSRLDRVKLAIQDLVDELQGDRARSDRLCRTRFPAGAADDRLRRRGRGHQRSRHENDS